MHFTTFVPLALGAMATVCAAPMNSKRAFEVATTFTDANFSGDSKFIIVNSIPSECVALDPNDSLTSVRVEIFFKCTFFVDGGCSGDSFEVNASSNPNVGDQFNDKISSMQCFSNA
ncbi:hypothetical protein DL96DRAFT_1622881 [Flagelloscypha sp. PMI_526]|nr:hypothetical protein DL96DRAFT_1622881 [Flagelloscypha sp. PMI_526]